MVVLRPWGMGARIGKRLEGNALQERKGPVSSRRGLPLGLRGKGGEERILPRRAAWRHQVGDCLRRPAPEASPAASAREYQV